MRVLHFYKTSLPDSIGGVEQFISQLSRGMGAYGIQAEVLSLAKNPVPLTIKQDGYETHRAKLTFQIASTGFSIPVFSQFTELVKQADIIHYHFPWPFMDIVHFATQVKKPTVLTYHSDIIRQKYLFKLYRPLMNKFLGSVDKIVATSDNYLSTSKILENYKDKTRVIPIGLDKATYPHASYEKMDYWRTKLGSKFFLFIGMIRYYKGLHILLNAMASMDYPLVILGTGPEEEALKLQASKLGLKHIHFLGYLPEEDKAALLTLCYSLVFPSYLRSEAFGIGLLEGAMYGKPMISCEIGTGTSYINISELTGLVVPPDDPQALQQALRYLWEHPEVAAEMGHQAKMRYQNLFQAKHMIKSYADLYKELNN